jgi:predicted alternative tryptophan synthase beta-subunit
MLALVVALGGCSFVAIHYPEVRPPGGGVRCLTALAIADTIAAAAALTAGSYRYAVEPRTSPFPLAMVVAGAWATASAIYGYTEDARCRSALTEPAR